MCLLCSTLQTAFTFLNLYHLGRENYRMLNAKFDNPVRSEMSQLQRQQCLSKQTSTLKEDSPLILDSSVYIKKLSLAVLTVNGRPNVWSLVSGEGDFFWFMGRLCTENCQPHYEMNLGNKLQNKQINSFESFIVSLPVIVCSSPYNN